MLTGELAFKGDYDQAVIYGITNDQPEPLTGLRTGVPLELERIVNRCISKEPQDRYQHTDDLLSELNRLKKDTDLEISQLKRKGPKKKRISIILPSIFISILVLIITIYLVLKPFQGDKKEFPAPKWENSIAVLPFADLSQDKNQEYFCVGMTDKILTSLSKLKVLKVIPRTSVMQYIKTEKTIPQIGRELQVENVLEGSIFKAGDRIRVTAQLISTSSHAHLWADDYELNYEDIFDIQDDISEKIANALLTTLSPEEKKDIKTIRPGSTEAYEYYLRGRHVHLYKYWDSGAKEDVFLTSEKMLKTAIKLDPDFADSYASLADLYNSYYNSLPDTASERDKYMQLQEAYLDTAYQLDPNSAEVNYAKGLLHDAKNEPEETFSSYKKALKANPNHDQIYKSMAIFLVDRGCLRLAMRFCTQAIEINPVNWEPYYGKARINMLFGELAEAESDFTKALEIEPQVEIKKYYWYLYVLKKQYEKASEYLTQLKAEYPEESFFNFAQALLYTIDGHKDKALSTLKSENWRHKAVVFSLLDMKDETIGVIQKRFEYHKKHKMSQYLVLRYDSLLDNIRSDPRFQEILAKHKKLYEENLAKYGNLDI
jgi:TolB-like protein/Tfp pilus assembly protein PilF